jgi:hypothetical protein
MTEPETLRSTFSFDYKLLRILPGVGLGRTAGSRQPVVAIIYDHGDWRCPFEWQRLRLL